MEVEREKGAGEVKREKEKDAGKAKESPDKTHGFFCFKQRERKKKDHKSLGDQCVEEYERKLHRAKRMAYISGITYGLTWFLGFCALTWASAVILGGLLTTLTRRDYYSTVVLLLLESVRLATTTFFAKFVTSKLVQGSADPQRLVYDDVLKQNILGVTRICEEALQLCVLAVSIIVPIRRLYDLNDLATEVDADSFDGTKTSLRIFYLVVLVNGCIATFGVLFSKHVVPFVVDTASLRKYYEKVVWMGMDAGLLHATDFEFLSWTFQLQADEYRSNMRAPVVMAKYGDMLKFLYFHDRYKGFEAARTALDSSDTYEREAAANIVGLWTTLVTEMENDESLKGPASGAKHSSVSSKPEGDNSKASTDQYKMSVWWRRLMPRKYPPAEVGKAFNQPKASSAPSEPQMNHSKANKGQSKMLKRLTMQRKILPKLAELLDNDETGRCASTSFQILAGFYPKTVLQVKIEGMDETVADICMNQIHLTVETGRHNNALLFIKTMIPLLPYLIPSGKEHECAVTMNSGPGGGDENYMPAESKREVEGGDPNTGNGRGNSGLPLNLLRLKEDMWKIVSKPGESLKRLQVVAAYAHHLLLSEVECRDNKSKLQDYLLQHRPKKPEPDRRGYLLPEENDLLLLLLDRGKMDRNEVPEELKGYYYVRQVKKVAGVPILARRTTALIAGLVIISIITISSAYIIKYANF